MTIYNILAFGTGITFLMAKSVPEKDRNRHVCQQCAGQLLDNTTLIAVVLQGLLLLQLGV